MTRISPTLCRMIILTYVCISGTSGQARMAKHLKEDIVKFPPNVPPKRSGSDVPVGHLRPLGW